MHLAASLQSMQQKAGVTDENVALAFREEICEYEQNRRGVCHVAKLHPWSKRSDRMVSAQRQVQNVLGKYAMRQCSPDKFRPNDGMHGMQAAEDGHSVSTNRPFQLNPIIQTNSLTGLQAPPLCSHTDMRLVCGRLPQQLAELQRNAVTFSSHCDRMQATATPLELQMTSDDWTDDAFTCLQAAHASAMDHAKQLLDADKKN